MGLFPQYQAICKNEQGGWFVARTDRGRVVGIASAQLDVQGRVKADGFAHERHMNCMGSLIDEAARWGAAHAASLLDAVILETDESKIAQFELAGFQIAASAEPFEADDQRLAAVHLKMPISTREFVPMHRHTHTIR